MARLAALGHRDFRLLFIGLFISITGTQMQRVAVAWQLYQLAGTPTAMGFLGLARVAPVLLLTMGGGVVADAIDRRKLMLVTQAGLAASSLVLAVFTHFGQASPALIYVVAALSGAFVAFDLPARQSLFPHLVPRADLPNALSLNAVAFEMGTIIGPVIAGFVIARASVLAIYVFDVCSFGAVIAALLAIRSRPVEGTRAEPGLSSFLEGLRFLRSSRLILAMMLLDFFATFFAGSLLLLPIFADRVLAVGPEVLGLLYAAQPAGAALTAVVLSLRPSIERQGRALLLAVAVYGTAILSLGFSRSLPVAMICLALSGAGDMISTVIRQTMRQLLTPDALRGRITALTGMFFLGGPQLGELEAGLLASATSVTFSIASGGAACLLVVLTVGLAVPELFGYRHSIQVGPKVEARG